MKLINKMNLDLDNKVAIINGGSKGIGFAIAKILSQFGVKVILVARSLNGLEKASDKIIDNGGEVLKIIQADLSDKKSTKTVEMETNSKGIYPDILINNAGGPPSGTFIEHDIDSWDTSYHQNLMSTIMQTKLFCSRMIEKKWGRIINISSTVAIEPSSEMVLSATFRSAVSAFAKSASLTLANSGVTINTICPGGVLTDRLDQLVKVNAEKENKSYQQVLNQFADSIPMDRFADPDEIGYFSAYLCSDYANYLTGGVYPFDGGLVKSF